jgi:hypothetical protein
MPYRMLYCCELNCRMTTAVLNDARVFIAALQRLLAHTMSVTAPCPLLTQQRSMHQPGCVGGQKLYQHSCLPQALQRTRTAFTEPLVLLHLVPMHVTPCWWVRCATHRPI